MGERTLTAPTPSSKEKMVSHYEEDPELLERRQRRSRLADDLLEDIVDDGDNDIDDSNDEPAEAPLQPRAAIADEDEAGPDHARQHPLTDGNGGVGRGAGETR